MKFVKRSIYLLLAIAMVFSFNVAIEYETLAVEKMNDELLELMSWVSDTTPFSVMIELKDKVPQDKLEKALDEVYKEYDMDAFYASEKNYIGNDKAYKEDYPKLLAYSDAYAAARREVLASFYYPHNSAFLEKYDLSVDREEYISSSVPYIHYVVVNKGIVNKMLYDSDVLSIVHYSSKNEYSASDETDDTNPNELGDLVEHAMQYVRGDINDLGVTGNGIKVGLIETGTPDDSILGGITPVNSTNVTPHATKTSYIIRMLSPNCTIYSYAVGPSTDSTQNPPEYVGLQMSSLVTAAYEALVAKKVHVINMSYAHNYTDRTKVAEQNAITRCLDKLIESNNVPLVVASGNANKFGGEGNLNFNVSNYATGFNSICVGGMSAPGTGQYIKTVRVEQSLIDDPTVKYYVGGWNKRGSMEMFFYSCWREKASIPNKPDLVAPGAFFNINEDTQLESGTSFAAPHVTSAIAWMLARNVYMQWKPEQIKAAVLGSAYTRNNDILKLVINDKTTSGDIVWASELSTNGTASEDYRGAGVLNAAYCYNVAYLGQRAQFTFTAAGQQQTYNVSVSNNGLPFRLAISWNATPDSGGYLNHNEYSVIITKNGTSYVQSQSQSRNLHQIVTIPASTIQTHGGGTYTVTITCLELNRSNDVVGMTWNNLNPLGYAPFNAQ